LKKKRERQKEKMEKRRGFRKLRLLVQKGKAKGSTRLANTGLLGGLEHLKIETRLIDEMLASVMGEYVFLK